MATIHIAIGQVFHLVCTVLVLSLALFAYERSIEPLYGSVPTAYYLAHVLYGATTVAYFAPAPSVAVSQFLLGIFLCAAPTTTYWIGVLTGRHGDPKWGPVVTHLVVLAPIFFVATSTHLNSHLIPSSPPVLEFGVKSQLLYYLPFLAVRLYLSQNPHFKSLPEDVLFLALSAFSLAMWRIIMSKSEAPQGRSKSNTIIFNVPILLAALLIPTMRAPTLRHPLLEPYIHPKYPLRILSSVQSTTGLVVVGEALPPATDHGFVPIHSMRYLRASHSLLGGVWIGDSVLTQNNAPPVLDSEGTPLGDSVYATFVLQEAVRLVNSTKGKDAKWDNALIIGLGTGISASAFARHNIVSTIVEIDPAVYVAARQYFGLPDPGPGRVFLEDARDWVANKRASITAADTKARPKLYDIVVHDCFSGGAVPKHIFTLEFWNDLKMTMNPEGVLAVNFAGHVNSNASHAILHTLQRSFGGCRVFHDSLQELAEEHYKTEFINMVFFCGVSRQPLSFRQAVESDYLNSHLRHRILSSLPEREIDLTRIIGGSEGNHDEWLLTDVKNPLGEWQQGEALGHWKVMREVLPDVFWETY